MRLWPRKWFGVKIFTSNQFRVRCAKREREKSLRRQWTQSPDHAPPKTRRREHHLRRSRPKANQRRRYRSRSRCSSMPSLPISFSFSTQRSSAPLISSSRSDCTNDLIVVSLSLKFSITLSSSLYQFDQICIKSVEVLSRFLFLKSIHTEIFVVKFVCDFDFLFSLFDLSFFLLLLWWCGCWCFGGFLVVWWWVLCGWWWKIVFSECYKTHENIF